MSAQRINRMNRNNGGGSRPAVRVVNVQHGRQDTVTRKREERLVRDAHRREKQISSYLAEDENFPSFRTQLAKIGLELRDIPGDGNCLFRALGDQFEGHVRNHFRHRQDVVKYMVDHKVDFEPFLIDDISFERHVSSLQRLGTYAGNDAIVAFARLRQVDIIIHQLNAPFFLIQGGCSSPNVRQLHLAYHNGDHYSSVRKQGDNTESPTSLRLKVNSESSTAQTKFQENILNDGLVRAVRNTDNLTEDVMAATGCLNEQHILACLFDCDYDVDATIAYVLQTMETLQSSQGDTSSLASQMTSTDSGIFCDQSKLSTTVDVNHNGLGVKGHYRDHSYGGSSGYGSVSSQNGGARPKLMTPVPVQAEGPKEKEKVNSKQAKKIKKLEKKKKAEERHKQRILGVTPPTVDDRHVNGDADSVMVISKDLQMARI